MWHSSHPQAPELCLTTEHRRGYSHQDGYSLAVSMADPMAVSLTELLANYKDLTEDTEHPAVPKYTFTHQPALPYPKCNHLTSAWLMHVPQCVNMKYNQSHIGNCNSPTLKKPNIIPTSQSNTQWPLQQKSILVIQTTYYQQLHPFYL